MEAAIDTLSSMTMLITMMTIRITTGTMPLTSLYKVGTVITRAGNCPA